MEKQQGSQKNKKMFVFFRCPVKSFFGMPVSNIGRSKSLDPTVPTTKLSFTSCLLHYARRRHNEEKTCPLDGDLDSQETRALTVQGLFNYA